MKFLVLVEVRRTLKPLVATFVITHVRSHITMLTPAMIVQKIQSRKGLFTQSAFEQFGMVLLCRRILSANLAAVSC